MSGQEYSTTIEVRFADLDAYGHVNNAVVFSYLETARVKLFQARFGDFLGSGLLFLVARAECDYRKPIELSDQVSIGIRVARVGRSSFELIYRLHDHKDTVFADAKTVMVCFDQRQGQPVAIPEHLRRALEPLPAAV